MKRFKFILIWIFWLVSGNSNAQSNYPFNISVGGNLELGTFLPSVENFETEKWIGLPGIRLGADPNLKFRYNNSLDLCFSVGGYINAYTFIHKNSTYDIAFYSHRYEIAITKHIPINHVFFEYLSFGMGIGHMPISNEIEVRDTKEFSANTYSQSKNPIYYSPSIGVYKQSNDKFGFNVFLKYSFFQSSSPYIYFAIESDQTNCIAKHNGNYLALGMSLDYNLRKKRSYPVDSPSNNVYMQFQDRELIQTKTLEVKNNNIQIVLWDHGIIDNDTISLTLNNRPLIINHKLSHKKTKINARLDRNAKNLLTVHAVNEGSVKPNSTSVVIKNGFKRYQYVLNSTLEESEQILIICK